jgi:hypothetical protein
VEILISISRQKNQSLKKIALDLNMSNDLSETFRMAVPENKNKFSAVVLRVGMDRSGVS